MISHLNMVSIGSAIDISDITISKEDIYLSYMPLPHLLERIIVW